MQSSIVSLDLAASVFASAGTAAPLIDFLHSPAHHSIFFFNPTAATTVTYISLCNITDTDNLLSMELLMGAPQYISSILIVV